MPPADVNFLQAVRGQWNLSDEYEISVMNAALRHGRILVTGPRVSLAPLAR